MFVVEESNECDSFSVVNDVVSSEASSSDEDYESHIENDVSDDNHGKPNQYN